MVYTERAETVAVSRGTNHANAVKYTTSMAFQNTRCKKLVTHVESNASAVSLLESGD